MNHKKSDILNRELVNLAREIINRFGRKYGKSLITMLGKYTPIEIVNLLCGRPPSGMFHMLCNQGAFELTVEAFALREEFETIIPLSTREAARRHLEYYGGLYAI